MLFSQANTHPFSHYCTLLCMCECVVSVNLKEEMTPMLPLV